MQGDIVSQGVELMLYGMGTVIVFLAALVVATTFMSRVITRHFPEPQPELKAPVPRAPAAGTDPQVVAAITAAIHQHRARRGK